MGDIVGRRDLLLARHEHLAPADWRPVSAGSEQGDREHSWRELDAPGASHTTESSKQQSSSGAPDALAARIGHLQARDRLTPAWLLSAISETLSPPKPRTRNVAKGIVRSGTAGV